ncbi:hypothetical protein QYE76_005504 [Lolium multiflorum]|uniref:Uncharacterized protein n=1 Tax=Lolium multiflorum TaxID=4521 RepID=A0AAD8W2A9_LOLMU|nr:hypothetical protein QYE76_005504 [Lolium multiflorum]
MNFDGSKRLEGAGAGVILVSPEGDKLKYVLRMTFPNASNNEAEYEALIHGMKMAKACGATRLKIFGDSQLVAQQVMNQCDAVNESMIAYKEVYNELEKLFDGCEVNHISRLSNDEADVLANIGSQCLAIPPGVFWEEISERSTKPAKIKKEKKEKSSSTTNDTVEEEEEQELVMMVQTPWMQAYISYILRKTIPDDPVEARRIIRRSKAFTVVKGELYKRSISGVLQRCVTPEEGRIILKDVHEGICGHHASSRAIAAKVFRAGFYWLTAIEDAKEIVRTCDACQRFAAKPHSPAAELMPIPLSWPFAQWGLDMVGKLHKASPGGYEYMLVAVDKFTKWIEAKPINSPDGASAIKFVKSIVFRFGVPHSIVTDNGSNFTSKEFKAYCAEVGIKLSFASVAHPQTNGQVEKANGIICNGIKKRLLGPLEKARHTWPEELPSVLWSIRTTPNTATQETPFFLVHGAEAVLPIEIEHDSPRVTEYDEETSRKALEDDVDALDEARDEVLSRVAKYQQDLKNYHSRRLRPRSFQVGDLVLRLNQKSHEKLESPWLGPYIVTEVIEGGAYRIKDKKTGNVEPNPWNVAQLVFTLRCRNIVSSGYSRLCGAENTREKRALRRAGIRRGNSLPEGEIDAIAIVIERDIISIIIIIISTIYTAITTAAPRHRCNNSGISMNEVRKKLFTISLSGKAAHWYKLLKNGDSIDWEDIVPLFYSKFYPPSEIHKDRNRIYNFWPHDGESIAQAWGRLKSLMLKCPIHELPGNVIIDNFYARLSFQDKTLLDTSCSGSFTRNKEEFKRDLLDRIQENTEGWENDKDRESGIIYDYKCIEAFMDTDKFRNMSATYGLDSQVVANLYKAFASHYELPKKNFDKYHEPYKDKVDSSVNKCVVIETVDNVIPEAYIEKTPFPVKMKEYSVISSAVNKSEKKPKEPEEQIKIEPAVAIVKDLVTENVEDGHIIFCEDASNIVSHPNKPKQVSVPMLSVRIGDHCYYGLCDIGASVSAIPYELYTEIMHEIGSCELEDIDVVIHLANRETISPIGIVRDVEVLCGKIKYPADFLVLGSAASDHCPIIFGRPFLNTCGAIIDCKKEKILTRFAGEPYEFNFSKFTKTPYKVDLPSNDFKMEQCASIVLVPNNPLQQHLENSESEAFRKERDELEEIFLRQPILKHDLPVEDLGTTPPPKEDPVFDLKPLPDNLKYAHIDDKKIYPVIISSKLSEIEEERLLEILKKHRGAIGYTLDDLKGISPSICQHAINMEEDAKPVVEHQRRLIPKMKEVVRNEVLKLLEAGIIYPIADSRWVSPVHCVPKKGGMTVVPNDNDELIPQRIVLKDGETTLGVGIHHDMIMSRVEHNSELIRNLTYEIEDLKELVKKLVERNPSPSSPKE